MNYTEFREKVKKYPFFRSNIFEHLTNKPAVLRRQVSDWLKKGYVLQLKRGMYTLREDDRTAKLSAYLLANALYSPSYISLETALSYYGFIPERVPIITSIASKKTQQFSNPCGDFIYRHLKHACYGGFITQQDEYGNNFFIATKEKAMVDFLYLKSLEGGTYDKSIFDLSYRLQNMDTLDKNTLQTLAKQYGQPRLCHLVELLIQQI